MPDNLHYNWQRYWVSQDGSIPIWVDGFPADPKDKDGKLVSTRLLSYPDIAHIPCLALLGEPGIGKSTALEEIKANVLASGESRLYLDLRSYSSEDRLYRDLFGSTEFNNWINSTQTLEIVLDSLDECLIHVRSLAVMLTDEIRKCPRSRLRLRIACRTNEWPTVLSKDLPDLWPGGFGAYELAPLLRRDVESALKQMNIRCDAFFEQMNLHKAVAFARTPLTLKFLLKTWKDQGFPADSAEMYRRGCRELCTESNALRRDLGTSELSADQALALAERIAALMILGKRAVISDEDSQNSDAISYPEMEGGQESYDGNTVAATIPHLREVVSSGLFNGRSAGMGWSHWSYAEFLAARYLATRFKNTNQIRDLVMHPDPNGISPISQVVPQLRETVGWLCAFRPEFIPEISAGSPEILLRSARNSIDDKFRASLVDSLLKLAAAGDRRRSLDWFVRDDYSLLAHGKLAQQLRSYIMDPNQDDDARDLAIDVAKACEVRDLLPEIIQIAINSSEPTWVRTSAAYCVRDLAESKQLIQLKPLLDLPESQDPEEDLKGIALDALWADHLSAAELLSHLKPPKHRSRYGAYAAFLHSHLVRKLRADDLVAALDWAKAYSDDDHNLSLGFRDAIAGIFTLSCQHLDTSGVLLALASLITERLKHHAPVVPARFNDEEESPIARDSNIRRQILEAVIPLLPFDTKPRPNFLPVSIRELALSDDLEWLIHRVVKTDDQDMRGRWLACVFTACDWSKTSDVEMTFEATLLSPYLKEAFRTFFQPVEIDSGEGRKMKAEFLKWRRIERRFPRESPPQLPEPFEEIIRRRLTAAEAGDVDAWWQLNYELTIRPPIALYHLEDEYESDLTELPSWKAIDASDHNRCVKVAVHYVAKADPKTPDWLGLNTFDRPAAAGYRAIRLLERESPELFTSISDESWKKWTPIILAFPESDGALRSEDYAKIVARAYRAAPDEVISTLIVLMRKEDTDHGHIFALRRLGLCWDPRLSEAILSFAEREPLKEQSIADILEEVLKHHLPGDAGRAIKLLKEALDRSPRNRDKIIKISAALLAHAARESWKLVWSVIESDVELGKAILGFYALRHDEMHTARIAAILDETDSAKLYIWLLQHFPTKDDPQHDGAYSVGARDAVVMFRNSILNCLQNKGTPEACTAIDQIIAAFAGVEGMAWLKRVRPAAVDATMKQTWLGQPPKVILSLAEQAERRIVESDEQLLEIVVESLERLEKKLHGTTPAVFDLWDESSQKPKDERRLSDYIKRHLEVDLQNRGIIANREVEIRDGVGAPGEVSDILVQAIYHTGNAPSVLSVLVEVKGCWNKDLKKAMKDQLLDRYLKENQCQTGLYIVGWFPCSYWSNTDYRNADTPKWTLDKARKSFAEQATALSLRALRLRSFVLDASVRSSP